MHKKITLTKQITLSIVLVLSLIHTLSAQVYQHDFGTTTISSYPYNVAPTLINSDLSNSVWTNTIGSWVSFVGATGQALGLTNSSGAASVSLTFTVAAGKQLSVDSFSFWRQRSPSGAQNWSMTINGINVGTGTVPQTAASTGTLAVTNPVTDLTGNVNVIISLSGASGVGTFRVDDFTLNGTVTATCVAPVITSINPLSGPANTLVTINGSGFQTGTGTSAVKFNGSDAAFTVVSDNLIRAYVPTTASTGLITVTTNSCPGNGPSFTLITPNCIVTPPVTDLYISELYDQESGSGGMIELYNPTNATIDLSAYTLQRYGNIADTTPTPGYVLNLTGTLGSEMIYLIACSAPNASICAAPSYSATLGSGFNGNDKFELLKNGVVIDRINVPFTAPGYTLIRNPDAIAPTTTYNSNDWSNTQHPNDQPGVNLPNNFCQDLGNHIVAPVSGTPPTLTQPLSGSVCENNFTSFSVILSDPTGFTYQWKVLNSSGNWINVIDDINYSGANSATLTLSGTPASFNGNQYYCEMVSGTCTLISNAAQLSVIMQPAIATVATVQPTCALSTGSITITAPVAADLTYSIDGTTFQTGTAFTNLAPGTYIITVKNAAGCTSTTAPITINAAPNSPAIATVTTVQPTCTLPTGSITITAPVDADLTYSIDGTIFQTSTTFNNLAPGTYTITVKNTAGCTSTTAPITINAAPGAPAIATITTVQPTCTLSTGSITITAPVAADLTYSIDGTIFQTSTTFNNLAPGTYTITVKNTAGCTSTTSPITINTAPGTPATATVTTVQPTCTLPTGSITITAPVSADLTYSIDGTTFQTSTTFNNLATGTYTITVKNTAGCTSTTAPITINAAPGEPATATVTTVQPTCTLPTGSITITAPVSADLTYSIDGTTFQTGTTFNNLAPGTYTITVKNTAGCTSTTSPVTINAAPGAPATATATTVQPTCTLPTGSITITAPVAAELTYSIDGTTFQTGTTFNNLTPGTYTITVKNTAGCTSTTSPVTVNTVPGLPQITTNQGCRNTTFGNNYIVEALPLDNSFDISTASFEWKNNQGNIIGNDENTFDVTQYIANNTGSSDFPLLFTVTVTNVQGCENTVSISIDSYFCNVPKGISPDNDGLNDTFNLTGLNVTKLSIFNRYGHEVYKKNNYTNEWHGQSEKDDELPTGTYYYVIETGDNPQTGWVYINRRD